MKSVRAVLCLGMLGIAFSAGASAAEVKRGHLETTDLPPYLRDRGDGLPLSMNGTYIQENMWIFTPFVEYYYNHDYEYSPEDLGYAGDGEQRGKFEAWEALVLLGYAPTDWLAFEVEFPYISAKLTKSPDDTSALPNEIEESGVNDIEMQIRWRYNHESATRPEFFSYFEPVPPTGDENSLIGTSDWEFKLGAGVVRGFSWGTVTFRAAAEYGLAEEALELGEIALEYVRRISPKWRVFLGTEGTQDEWELIPEVQLHFTPKIFARANCGIGLTSKATDVAPELGVIFSF